MSQMRKPPGSRSSLGDLVEDRGGLLAPPAERAGQVCGAQLARAVEDEERELTPRRIPGGQSFRQAPFAGEEVVGERPPGAALVDEVGVREHEPVMQRRDRAVDLFLLEPGRRAKLRPGQRPELADRLDDHVAIVRRLAVCRDERRQETWGDTGDGARQVLAHTAEAATRQLVLGPPEEVDLVGVPVDLLRRRHLLPQGRQNDVGFRKEHREPDLVDPLRCLRHRAYHRH